MLDIQKHTEEEIDLPQWLSNQLMRAFYKKDLRQIKLLNDCWFFYHKAPGVEFDANNG